LNNWRFALANRSFAFTYATGKAKGENHRANYNQEFSHWVRKSHTSQKNRISSKVSAWREPFLSGSTIVPPCAIVYALGFILKEYCWLSGDSQPKMSEEQFDCIKCC